MLSRTIAEQAPSNILGQQVDNPLLHFCFSNSWLWVPPRILVLIGGLELGVHSMGPIVGADNTVVQGQGQQVDEVGGEVLPLKGTTRLVDKELTAPWGGSTLEVW
jgi:hypothetical protein